MSREELTKLCTAYNGTKEYRGENIREMLT